MNPEDVCPVCAREAPVPKWTPFWQCLFNAASGSMTAHGHSAAWFECCEAFSICNTTYGGGGFHFRGAYRPGDGWLQAEPDLGEEHRTRLTERMDVLAQPPPAEWVERLRALGPTRLAVHWKPNMVESVHHEFFSQWLATAGPGAPVTVVDCTRYQFAARYWPAPAASRLSAEWGEWISVMQAGLRLPDVVMPRIYTCWPTFEATPRGIFRRFLELTFGLPEKPEPMLLICLRWNWRRWDMAEALRFVALCRERLRCRIVVQGVPPPGEEPELPAGVESLFGTDIEAQVEAAKRATYCVVPHGAAMLWSWISAAPTLEMMPPCGAKLLTDFASLPLGANVKRILTNSTEWNGNFDHPNAEEAFAAMMEHSGQTGAMLK